ncbi:hypothetical protein RN001_001967 [Aquatica leii]|uniref:Dysbindin protein homolog n=1 Tax=Aquatica leii TaxID=1421715 RepID=A0AAN7PP97_9COLE|nr:hypothetical protein RN001_001967 [Aquatica leii]
MLTSLKGRFLNVSKISLLSPTSEEETVKTTPTIALNAGGEILSHFQEQWAELHNLNEENAANAAKLADQINVLHSKTSTEHANIIEMIQILNSTPTINKSIENCFQQIKDLQESFVKIEKGILDLEDVVERVELEKRKVEHKYQLALYKEKKIAYFEKIRSELAAKHSEMVTEKESKQRKVLEERQQAFQEAFNSDLATFKSLGTIPKIEKNTLQSSALLEEIQLDLDPQDLETFLNSK